MFKIFFFLLSLSTISMNSVACSCAEIRGNARMFMQGATSVFIGIPATTSRPTGAQGQYGDTEVKTTFKILKNFKNSFQKEVSLYSTKDSGANCGTEFKKNAGAVLIFTYMDNNKLSTDGCSVLSIDHDQYTAEVLLELLN